MKIKNTQIEVVQADITELEVDAIVNAANNELVMGGGVAGAIKRKGGQIIEDDAVKHGPIKIGCAVAASAGKLSVKYVIHAATMGMDFKTDEHIIRNAARNTFGVAQELKIKSIAFPALGCGVGRFPYLASAKIMAQETLRYLRGSRISLEKIVFCVYDNQAKEVFTKGVMEYLNHIIEKNGPFITVDIVILMPLETGEYGIILIKRTNPPFGWALPGGFVDYGETLEEAAVRESKEETGLDLLELTQFHIYSAPGRDPRFHTISAVFVANGKGLPKAGDDAADLKVVKLDDLDRLQLAFDHKVILQDYMKYRGDKDR